MRLERRIRLFGIIFFFYWTLFTLYPNPINLVVSIARIFNPPIDYYVEEIKPLLRESYNKEPAKIDQMIKERISYRHDWITYNMPWYFPTVEEIMERGRGDCKSRLLVTATIFEYHNIPYNRNASPTHVWIEYEDKNPTRNENEEVTLMSFSKERTKITLPKVDLKDSAKIFKDGFWEPMPKSKKTSLFLGIIISSLFITHPKKFYLESQFKRG